MNDSQHDDLIATGSTLVVYGSGNDNAHGTYSCILQSEDTETYYSKTSTIDSDFKYEIHRHEYLKNPNDIPDARLNKSGAWILSLIGSNSKQMLYAVNCPFKHKIKANDWIVLNGSSPAPMIKIYEENEANIKQTCNNEEICPPPFKKQKMNKMEMENTETNKEEISNKLMIISGGQTGVDRAALDVAIALNIPYSGYIPKGRKAEDGMIDGNKYANLKECDSEKYEDRTLLNVMNSDATLILNIGKLEGGTLKTREFVSEKNKDLMYITLTPMKDDNDDQKMDVDEDEDLEKSVNNDAYVDARAERVCQWIQYQKIKVLNIAGPREGERKGVYRQSRVFLNAVLKHFKDGVIPPPSLF